MTLNLATLKSMIYTANTEYYVLIKNLKQLNHQKECLQSIIHILHLPLEEVIQHEKGLCCLFYEVYGTNNKFEQFMNTTKLVWEYQKQDEHNFFDYEEALQQSAKILFSMQRKVNKIDNSLTTIKQHIDEKKVIAQKLNSITHHLKDNRCITKKQIGVLNRLFIDSGVDDKAKITWMEYIEQYNQRFVLDEKKDCYSFDYTIINMLNLGFEMLPSISSAKKIKGDLHVQIELLDQCEDIHTYLSTLEQAYPNIEIRTKIILGLLKHYQHRLLMMVQAISIYQNYRNNKDSIVNFYKRYLPIYKALRTEYELLIHQISEPSPVYIKSWNKERV